MARVAICCMAPFFVTINTLAVICCLQIRFAYIFSFSFSIVAVCANQDWTCSVVMMTVSTSSGHCRHLCMSFVRKSYGQIFVSQLINFNYIGSLFCCLVHRNHFVSWALNQTWILLGWNIASMTSFAVNIL